MEERVKKFKDIFYGLDRAYGQYKSDGQLVNGKASGQAFIKKAPVTDQLWIDHIEGKDPSLGIIPIRDDSKCIWGCIDIDTYPLDHKKIVRKIRELELPLVMCRSKSGGAHVFLFTKEPVQAKLVRDKLQEWAGELGYANCEIFPKQIEIKADRGDTGNFLNLPYHGGDDSMRHGYSDDGSASSLSDFFTLYDRYCTTEKSLKEFQVKRKNDVELKDGPPCLSTLMSQGIPPGGRDNTLYQYAVYAKKKWPEEWQTKIEEFNHKYMETPLPAQQVVKTIRQHEKKDYQYKCKDQPMCAVCSQSLCRGKQYGIGNNFEHQVSDLTKFESDESTWFLNIDGRILKLSTDQFYNQHKFRQACMNEINVMPNMMRPGDWDSRIQMLLDTVVVIQMPHEITKTGVFETLLERFLEDQGEAEHIDEIDMGKAFFEEREYEEKEGKVKRDTAYFKSEWLQKFLKRNDFKDFSRTEMTAHIRNKLGGGDVRRKIKGKTAYLWYVPWIKKSSDEFATPDMGEETPFLMQLSLFEEKEVNKYYDIESIDIVDIYDPIENKYPFKEKGVLRGYYTLYKTGFTDNISVFNGNTFCGLVSHNTGKIIGGFIDGQYVRITLQIGYGLTRWKYYWHRLISLAFIINDDPKRKKFVNHKNQKKYDNSLENLEWITPSENSKSSNIILGYSKSAIEEIRSKENKSYE